MIRYCQYCAEPVNRTAHTPFTSCGRCTRQRAAILRDFRRKYNTFWFCDCPTQQPYKESYCLKCLALRKDKRKLYRLKGAAEMVEELPVKNTAHRCLCAFVRGKMVLSPKCKQHGT